MKIIDAFCLAFKMSKSDFKRLVGQKALKIYRDGICYLIEFNHNTKTYGFDKNKPWRKK